MGCLSKGSEHDPHGRSDSGGYRMQISSEGRSPVIAVVDDDSSVRHALRRLCRAVGFDGRDFGTAKEFLVSIETETYDCAIVDIRMPGMNGLELQQKLLVLCPTLPVILITAHDEPAGRSRALTAGAVAYLRKPFSNEEILSAIHRGLQGGPFKHDLTSEEKP
jgi:FixJ family two-component response regulator